MSNLMITVNGVEQYRTTIAMGSDMNARRVTKAAYDICHQGVAGAPTPGVAVYVRTARGGWEHRVIVKKGGRYYTRVGSYLDLAQRAANPCAA